MVFGLSSNSGRIRGQRSPAIGPSLAHSGLTAPAASASRLTNRDQPKVGAVLRQPETQRPGALVIEPVGADKVARRGLEILNIGGRIFFFSHAAEFVDPRYLCYG